MDRNIVYPGSIPLDTDLLSLNRNMMVALGSLAHAVFGNSTVVNGLMCKPTTPASLNVIISPGSITQLGPIDTTPYGSIPADTTDPIIKMGVAIRSTTFSLSAPVSVGQSIVYLVEAAFLEADVSPVVLPYYNAANPSQTFSGPNNSGAAQNTVRSQTVQLQLKAGAPANTGSQVAPAVDAGWIGLYGITVSYGQTTIVGGQATTIYTIPTAPFVPFKLPMLRPGFGSAVPQVFTTSQNWAIPAGVTQVEVEVWGAGSGSFASVSGAVSGAPSGGGSGGGYARKLVSGLTSGMVIAVTVGAGGVGGTTSGLSAGAGGASSFGAFVSASGGSLNQLAVLSPMTPVYGATPPGQGSGGDVNFSGSAGQAGLSNQGGMGGAAPMGGAQNSGTSGNQGLFPGGGAAGAGTGANSNTAYNGAAGAGGLVVVRW